MNSDGRTALPRRVRIREVGPRDGFQNEPEVIPTRGSLPTLVLTAGQGTYTAADLVQYGALVMLPPSIKP